MRRPAAFVGCTSSRVFESHLASTNSYGKTVARDRARQGGANPAAGPAHVDIESKCVRGSARFFWRGVPALREGTVDLAAWGSQAGTACRQNGCVPTSTVTGWPRRKVCGRRRGSHRRSRAGSPLPLGVRRDKYVGDARSQAREAGRGDRTVAPCPRPAGRPCLAGTKRFAGVRGVHPIGRLYRCVAIRRNTTRTSDETRWHAWC